MKNKDQKKISWYKKARKMNPKVTNEQLLKGWKAKNEVKVEVKDIKTEAIAESKMSDVELKEKFEKEIDKAEVALDKVLDSVTPPVV